MKIGFHKGLSYLYKRRIITKKIKNELEWVWGIRCKQHFESLKKIEFGTYVEEDYKNSWKILVDFHTRLLLMVEKGKIIGRKEIKIEELFK